MNGAITPCQVSHVPPELTFVVGTSAVLHLATGDHVELFARQDSGGNLDVEGQSEAFIAATYIGA